MGDDTIMSNVDPKQFGGLAGTSTTDALVEMTHKWYEATDKPNTYVRIVLLDFSKAFDLINHKILLEKLQVFGIPAPILRWMAAFLLDRTQRVKIENNYKCSEAKRFPQWDSNPGPSGRQSNALTHSATAPHNFGP